MKKIQFALLCASLALTAVARADGETPPKPIKLTREICDTMIKSGKDTYQVRLEKGRAALRKHIDHHMKVRSLITDQMRQDIGRYNNGELTDEQISKSLAGLNEAVKEGDMYLWKAGNKVFLMKWSSTVYHVYYELSPNADREYREFYDRTQDHLAAYVSNDYCFMGSHFHSECVTKRPEAIFRNEREFLEGNTKVPAECFRKEKPGQSKVTSTEGPKLMKVPASPLGTSTQNMNTTAKPFK